MTYMITVLVPASRYVCGTLVVGTPDYMNDQSLQSVKARVKMFTWRDGGASGVQAGQIFQGPINVARREYLMLNL